jgi:hypothetical protein
LPVSDSEPGIGGRESSVKAVGYFERVADAFRSAAGRNGTRELTYGLGGEGFRMRFAGEALPPLMTPALEHLVCDSFRSGLTVNLWDAPSTGVDLPGPPWNRGDLYGNGAVRGFEEGRYRACVDLAAGLYSLFDAERKEGFVWVRDPAALPLYVVAAPLRVIFHWWMGGHDRQLAHAAAVGTDRGGVLLAGAGGAGKSTAAFACLRSGLRYAGDDYVLIAPRPAPRVTCLYNSGKLEARNMAERFPELLDRVHNADAVERENDKGLVFVHRHWPDSVFPLPGARAAAIERLGALVRSVPGYYLEIGADLLDVPAVIQDFLTRETGCPPVR